MSGVGRGGVKPLDTCRRWSKIHTCALLHSTLLHTGVGSLDTGPLCGDAWWSPSVGTTALGDNPLPLLCL